MLYHVVFFCEDVCVNFGFNYGMPHPPLLLLIGSAEETCVLGISGALPAPSTRRGTAAHPGDTLRGEWEGRRQPEAAFSTRKIHSCWLCGKLHHASGYDVEP